jgi:hypothetical protein
VEARTVVTDELAALKFAIVSEENQLAQLARSGQKLKARVARERLYLKLNRLEILEALAAEFSSRA